MGDWDCDGDETPGVYRPSTARLYLRNSNTSGIADKSYMFGNPGDSPVAGDFNKNGCDTVSVYRSSGSMVYIKNHLSDGIADSHFMFGNPGDRAFSGDFDGDGIDTIGLRRDALGCCIPCPSEHRRALPTPSASGIRVTRSSREIGMETASRQSGCTGRQRVGSTTATPTRPASPMARCMLGGASPS